MMSNKVLFNYGDGGGTVVVTLSIDVVKCVIHINGAKFTLRGFNVSKVDDFCEYKCFEL